MKTKEPIVEPKPSLSDRVAALEKAHGEIEAACRQLAARLDRLEQLVGK